MAKLAMRTKVICNGQIEGTGNILKNHTGMVVGHSVNADNGSHTEYYRVELDAPINGLASWWIREDQIKAVTEKVEEVKEAKGKK